MKTLIRTSWNGRCLNDNKLVKGLLQYRNTPSRKDGLSPAQKLYGRPVQDTLPAHRRAFSPEWQCTSDPLKQKEKPSNLFYNQHARPLPEIHLGTKVAIQNSETKRWDIYGTVVHIGPHRRYFVKTHSGSTKQKKACCFITTPIQFRPHNECTSTLITAPPETTTTY